MQKILIDFIISFVLYWKKDYIRQSGLWFQPERENSIFSFIFYTDQPVILFCNICMITTTENNKNDITKKSYYTWQCWSLKKNKSSLIFPYFHPNFQAATGNIWESTPPPKKNTFFL